MPTRTATRYEDDVYTWTVVQAAALRRAAASRVNLPEPIDFLNVAEEIESLGISQLRELRSRYIVLLVHLLKWRHQPEKQSPSWHATIRTQRREIADLLAQSPGLKPKRHARLLDAYRAAREDAAYETGLPEETFPETCPYTLDEVESAAFWPGEG
jgi:hypothetical protein